MLLGNFYKNELSKSFTPTHFKKFGTSFVEIPIPLHNLVLSSIKNLSIESQDGFLLIQADALAFSEHQHQDQENNNESGAVQQTWKQQDENEQEIPFKPH